MKKETLTALKKSIQHWKKLASGGAITMGAKHCALCKLFNPNFENQNHNKGACTGCPVQIRAGSFCRGTPYDEALFARDDGFKSKRFKIAARAELKFLRSLLPKSKTKPSK